MRVIFRSLYDHTPTPRLHGISAMGQRLAVYCLDKATRRMDPKYVAPPGDYIIDTVPAERWDTDIMTEGGYQKFNGGYQRCQRNGSSTIKVRSDHSVFTIEIMTYRL